MALPFVIGITGPARAGKDTTANFIVAAVGGYVYSMAMPMKAMLKCIGVNFDDPYWEDHKEQPIAALGVSPRLLLQTLGTEWGRQRVNPDLWVLLAKQRLLQYGRGMVVPDIRFENEAAWVRNVGGLIIHLTRKNATPVRPHSSEAGVERAPEDKLLSNDGSLEDLQHHVRDMLDGLKT